MRFGPRCVHTRLIAPSRYSVDRSTISKILIQQHRWMGPAQPTVVPIPKPIKQTGGGRFPAIEKRMDDWMDEQFKLGYEIRDQVARDKAKEIAREMGFTEERFKASAKWLDKVSHHLILSLTSAGVDPTSLAAV